MHSRIETIQSVCHVVSVVDYVALGEYFQKIVSHISTYYQYRLSKGIILPFSCVSSGDHDINLI